MQTKATPRFYKTAETSRSGEQTLAQRYFISAEIFAQEEANIFSRQWVVVGHQSEIDAIGDYFVAEVARESLIVTRPPSSNYGVASDQELTIRAFYNVCRHRGTRLCEDKAGHAVTLQCPYHAWTYGLDGRLLGVPHLGEVRGFDKAAFSLHPVNVALWEGFVFVNLAKKPAPLAKVFAPLAGKFSHWNLPQLCPASRIDYEVRANWKLIFENYSECYHCPGVHPALSQLTPWNSAENDLCEGPFLGGFMPITKGRSLTTSGKACALPVGDIRGKDHARVFYYSIFPNMLLSMHPDYVMVHQIWPQSPERSLVRCDWFFHPEAFARTDFHPDEAVEFWDMTNKQDWHVCELSQQGIASRAYRPGPYSARESLPAAWDREYLRRLR